MTNEQSTLDEIKVILEKMDVRLTAIENYKVIYSNGIIDSLDYLHDQVKTLLEDKDRIKHVDVAIKIADKFEDYMKNVDKLNAMVNEIKGCASIARAALEKHKHQKN